MLAGEGLEHPTAAICAIAKGEDAYIDEWISYQILLGFDSICIYDNSEDQSLRHLPARYPKHVTVVPWPGPARQVNAYQHYVATCEHTWCALLDVDEFIVLRKHARIKEFLAEHCASGAVSLNWYLFGSSGEKTYRDEPVLTRFQMRGAEVNWFVKSIFRPCDVSSPEIHAPFMKEGKTRRDTNGKVLPPFDYGFNVGGPTDVAVVHHYFTKSWGEFLAKVARLRADTGTRRNLDEFATHDLNEVRDSSAADFVLSKTRAAAASV